MNPNNLDYLSACEDAGPYKTSENQELFLLHLECGKEWYKDLSTTEVLNLPKNQLSKNCRNYIVATRGNLKPVGFVGSVIFWFIARAILSWVVNKIIDHLMKVDKPKLQNAKDSGVKLI